MKESGSRSIRIAIICLLLLIIVPFNFYAQSDGLNDTLAKAEKLFEKGEFLKALPYYEHLDEQFPDTSYFQFKLGVCCLEKSDRHQKALSYLKQVEEKNAEAPELKFYLGRAYHMNYKFGTAINYFMLAREEYKKNEPRYKEISRYIENCESGMELYSSPRAYVSINNIAAPINTEGKEYGPAISADGNTLIFTYRGKYSKGGMRNGEYDDDILIAKKLDNGLWSAPKSIGEKVNTELSESSISLSPDGQQLFIYKYTPEDRGDIYVSTFDPMRSEWSAPVKLEGDVNTEFWEGSCSLSPDGKTLYFVSSRIGGYGGKDLYKATLQEDGTWREVENLGPEMNTEQDEDGPFLYPNGTVLFFGSNGHNSMGGFDIFQSELSEEGYWSQPVNLGYPVNTVNHDIYYTISASGRGYYASEKKGGYGPRDIYVVDPGFIGRNMIMALVKGVITTNGEPEGADIFVTDSKGNEMREMYRSNADNGNYVLTLLPGQEYNLTYMAEDGSEEVRTVNTMDIDSFTIIDINIDFNTYVSDKLNKAYEQALENADEAFNNDDYLNAIVYYSQALGYKPDEQYPKDRIKEARDMLNKQLRSGEEIVMKDLNDKYGSKSHSFSGMSPDNSNNDLSVDGDDDQGDIIIKQDAIDGADDSSTRYTLQIAASSRKSLANSIENKFKNLGHNIYIQHVTFTDVNEQWYRVRTGTFTSLDQAIDEARKLLKEPLPSGKVWVDVRRENKFSTQKGTYDKTPLIEK